MILQRYGNFLKKQNKIRFFLNLSPGPGPSDRFCVTGGNKLLFLNESRRKELVERDEVHRSLLFIGRAEVWASQFLKLLLVELTNNYWDFQIFCPKSLLSAVFVVTREVFGYTRCLRNFHKRSEKSFYLNMGLTKGMPFCEAQVR